MSIYCCELERGISINDKMLCLKGIYMNKYYDEIMQLKGADEFKDIIRKWQNLSDNMNEHPSNEPVLLPDMLWVAKSGSGKTRMLSLLSDYLYSAENLMDFYGDVKYFEFLLSYCDPAKPFTELNRLVDEVSNAAGFRNEFKGIMFIDIDEWKQHFEEKHFISFMEFLSSGSDNWMIILSIDSDKDEDTHNLEAFISMFLRIEKISILPPSAEDLFHYLESGLFKYGLTLADDAKELLFATIEKLRSNKYFDGFKSIKMLYQDIVYTIFSVKKVDSLTAAMLSEFSADSDYIKRISFNSEKIRKIGFR